MTRLTAWVAAGLLGAVTAACSSGTGVTRPEMRDDVRSTTQDVVALLGEQAGRNPLRAAGSSSVCEEGGYEYGVGALLRPEDDLASTVDDAERLLTGDGWEVDASERGEIPFVSVTKGPMRVSVKASQIDRGDVEVEVVHDCIDGERDDTPSFDSEPIDVR